MTPIILHGFYHDNYVRSISSPGLNQHQGQGSSFICTFVADSTKDLLQVSQKLLLYS